MRKNTTVGNLKKTIKLKKMGKGRAGNSKKSRKTIRNLKTPINLNQTGNLKKNRKKPYKFEKESRKTPTIGGNFKPQEKRP